MQHRVTQETFCNLVSAIEKRMWKIATKPSWNQIIAFKSKVKIKIYNI